MKLFLKNIIIKIITLEARLVLRKYKPRIVAITGNVGKTSTKDAVAAVLAGAYHVRKSEKSFNSDIGIPLAILGCKSGWDNPFLWIENIFVGILLLVRRAQYPAWLVLEVGADHPGDIERVTKWLHPNVVVVTRIGEVPVHVEYFTSVDELAKEKQFLARAVDKEGTLILDASDSRVLAMKDGAHSKVFTFGNNENAMIYASHEQILYDKNGRPEGITFRANYNGISVPVRLFGTVGFHHTSSILAALLVGVSQDINIVSAVEWIGQHTPPLGRLRIIPGLNGSIILDDTYNASPTATYAALVALGVLETKGRKIAVFGDMMELGKFSKEEHQKVGVHVAEVCDLFYLVGSRMRDAAGSAKEKGMKEKNIIIASSAREAGQKLQNELKEGDVVLVKGSQFMRMERVVEDIMAYPEDAKTLLVRQDEEWAAR